MALSVKKIFLDSLEMWDFNTLIKLLAKNSKCHLEDIFPDRLSELKGIEKIWLFKRLKL